MSWAAVSSLCERLGRALVVGAVVAVAVWTVCYQVALFAGLPSTPTLVVAALVTVAVLILAGRRPPRSRALPTSHMALPMVLAVLATTAVSTTLGATGHRELAVALAVGGAATGLLLILLRQPVRAAPEDPDADPPTGTSRLLWPTAWVLAGASAALASIVANPNGDDAYFVNLSTWVAERGRFPLRDTMISPNVFPAIGGHSPPIHSVEGLLGAVARVLGIEAGTATYVLAAPAGTALGVLVLAYAVAEARIRAAALALLGVVGYLWTTGASGYSLGSFFGVRMWQGKSMLVSIALPLVFILASRLLARGGLRNHLLLGAAVVAAVGLSNTAVFLLPVLLGAVAVAGLALREVRGALRVVSWLVVPLLFGALTLLLEPQVPTIAQMRARGFEVTTVDGVDPLFTVPAGGGIFVATALGVGLGLLGLRVRAHRAAAMATVVAVGLSLLPPVRNILDAVGLGSVAWRMWWVVPITVLLAGAVGAAAEAAARVSGRVGTATAAAAAAAAVALVPLVDGAWVGASQVDARFVHPLTWKVPAGALTEAEFIESISDEGDTVLAPWDTSRVLAALTVDIRPVSARQLYLRVYVNTPAAHAAARDSLQEFADGRPPVSESALTEELDLLDVRTACVESTRERAVGMLEDAGFSAAGDVNDLTCLRR